MEWNKLGIKKKTTFITSRILNALESTIAQENNNSSVCSQTPQSTQCLYYFETRTFADSSLSAETNKARGLEHWRRWNRPA